MKEKVLYCIAVIFIITTCFSCNNSSIDISKSSIYSIDSLIYTNPDSAISLLNSIDENKLNKKAFAHRCMLAGKISDKTYTPTIPTYQFEEASQWFIENGTFQEQAQILLYLGRSYSDDGDYNIAITTYTKGLDIASKHGLVDLSGLFNSYIGDLYESKGMISHSIEKYKRAADLFKESSNNKSLACALRDCGRGYARIDSADIAIRYLQRADSICFVIKNSDVEASIVNTLAGIYFLLHKYEEAKSYYLRALSLGRNAIPNYIGLVEVYLKTDSIIKAKDLLAKIAHTDNKYAYSIKSLQYEINKKEQKYQEALSDLEECLFLVDSISQSENQSKILSIEQKYNNLKVKEKVNELTIKNQQTVIITTISITIALIIIFALLIHRKRIKEKIQKQRIELDKTKIEFLNLSLELKRQQELLVTFNEQSNQYNKILNHVTQLKESYKKLQRKIILSSDIYKEMSALANKNIPRNDKALITSRHWKLIVEEVNQIYPNLYFFVNDLYPNISEQEWQYCCFCMLGFDTNSEAKLLNINPTSVRTKRLRLRQKLNLTLTSKGTFYDCIVENLLP